jgi:hypothetical protein
MTQLFIINSLYITYQRVFCLIRQCMISEREMVTQGQIADADIATWHGKAWDDHPDSSNVFFSRRLLVCSLFIKCSRAII